MLKVTEVSWQGPIPPPQALQAYDDIIENGAERLFRQFEKETEHRHKLERRTQTFPLYDQLAARVAALLFSLACLGVALHAITAGQPWVAGTFGAAMIAVGVNAFLRQRRPPTTPAKADGATRSEQARRKSK